MCSKGVLQCFRVVCCLHLHGDKLVDMKAEDRGSIFHHISIDLYCVVQKHNSDRHLNKNHHDNLEICMS
jgi:hypothetical protein